MATNNSNYLSRIQLLQFSDFSDCHRKPERSVYISRNHGFLSFILIINSLKNFVGSVPAYFILVISFARSTSTNLFLDSSL